MVPFVALVERSLKNSKIFRITDAGRNILDRAIENVKVACAII